MFICFVAGLLIANNPKIKKQLEDECKAKVQEAKKSKRIGKRVGASGLKRARKKPTNSQRKLMNPVPKKG